MANDLYAHRKAARRLRFVRPDGTPVASTPVHIAQQRHAFLFGSGAFDAIPLANATDEAQQAFLQDRMDKWLALFNYGTLPFYWGRHEPERGKHKNEEVMRGAKWLQARDVILKGHPLCWHTVSADWLMELDNDEILRVQLERIGRDVTAFKGVIDMWDVINEVVIMPIFDKYDNGITRICKQLGRVSMIREVFAAARVANPSATLLLNDFNTTTNYEILIDGCLQAGIPIDVIGIQSHQHQGYWGMEKLQEVLARFDHFGLPIHFTENTLISGDLMPAHIDDLNDWQVPTWPSTPDGEARQAAEMTEMYRALFAHPLVEGVTNWDFTDGQWLGAPSGVLYADNGIKPAYEALRKLIKEEWWTDETITTDADGYATVTGYKGDYEASADGSATAFTLVEDGEETLTI